MSRPLLLDLYCGAGGAGMGYHQAGFDVLGVDINPQPNYPFEFIQADAVEFLRDEVLGTWPTTAVAWRQVTAAIHTSPPCQAYTSLTQGTNAGKSDRYPDLLPPTRELLDEIGLPYVIENVVGAPLIGPVRLCGSSFGIGVRRHRLFEMSEPPVFVPPCAHHLQPEPLDVTGGGPSRIGRTRTGGGVSRKPRTLRDAQRAMGIEWMTRAELNESIPPAYTSWIGQQLLTALERAA